MTHDYAFIVRPLGPDDGGGWLVEFPDLPGCMADGHSPEAAIGEAEDALNSYIATLRELGRPIPRPSRPKESHSGHWMVRAPRTLHRRLAERAKAEGVSLNQLTVAMLSEGLGGKHDAA